MPDLTFRLATPAEKFETFWQSEEGWARFWDLLQDKEARAADWKRSVLNAFLAGYEARMPTAHKAGKGQ